MAKSIDPAFIERVANRLGSELGLAAVANRNRAPEIHFVWAKLLLLQRAATQGPSRAAQSHPLRDATGVAVFARYIRKSP